LVSNLISGKVYAEITASDDLEVGVSAQGYWLAEEWQQLQGPGKDDYIGAEIDVDVAYNIYSQLTYELEAAYMLTDNEFWGVGAGEYNKVHVGIAAEDIDAADIWFLGHKLVYSF
jgi:hypothetical protein